MDSTLKSSSNLEDVSVVYTDSLGKYSITFESKRALYLHASKDGYAKNEWIASNDHIQRWEMNFVLRKCITCPDIRYPPTPPF